jgi:Ubiquitin family
MSVTDLKVKLSDMTHKASETIRLIYKAKNLEDSKKISDYSKHAFSLTF